MSGTTTVRPSWMVLPAWSVAVTSNTMPAVDWKSAGISTTNVCRVAVAGGCTARLPHPANAGVQTSATLATPTSSVASTTTVSGWPGMMTALLMGLCTVTAGRTPSTIGSVMVDGALWASAASIATACAVSSEPDGAAAGT